MPRKTTTAKQTRPQPAVTTVIPLPEHREIEAFRKALAAQQAGDLAAAVTGYDATLSLQPDKIAALVNKGVALRQLGRHGEAMACFWRAIALDNRNIEAWHNAANTLLDQERFDEAAAALKVAIAGAPMVAEVWAALGRLLIARRQFVAAETVLQRAVALRPELAATRRELAALLLELGKLDHALVVYRDLQAVLPQDSLAHSGTGQALTGLGRLQEALPHFHRAIALDPDNLDAQLGLARCTLLNADYEAGWRAYEARRARTDRKRPAIDGPEWDGSDPAGQTILVYAEQGFGDTIQFLRYLPALATRGARVIVLCQKSLQSLVSHMPGVSAAICTWRPLPDYDRHVPLLSLPHKLQLAAPLKAPAAPYLLSHKSARLPVPPLGTHLRVGLVWAGSATHPDDHNRSAGLEALLPLAGIAGVQLYSLQVGPRAQDAAKLAHPALIIDFSKHLKDFADTASVIKELDLVISVDSAVAHLAGALGKPVWILVPSIPDWRWQTGRSDTPWYPSMTLFRQKNDGSWAPAIEEMVGRLGALAAATPLALPEPATIEAMSVFAGANGEPRFHLSAPRALLGDPGINFLVRKERSGIGYEYATRAFLDAHLAPSDLFIDVGAHWGLMTLQAATRFRGADKVSVLAFEPSAGNAAHFREWIAGNGVSDQVTLVNAAVSDQPGQGVLRPESTMGLSLRRDAAGDVPVVTIDQILAQSPQPGKGGVIVKIDVEGHEPEVIAGMTNLLGSGRVKAIIWERGTDYTKPDNAGRVQALRRLLTDYGFTAWRFASEDEGGALQPFADDGATGNVFEMAPDHRPLDDYRPPRLRRSVQAADPLYDIAEQARAFYAEGTQAYAAGKMQKSLTLYAESASRDMRQKDLYNNLGVMLRDQGRHAAKLASYAKARALAPHDPGIASNLANGLREAGRFDEALTLYKQAMQAQPDNPVFLYNAGLVIRDDGRPKEALTLFERTLALDPDNADCRWDRALVLLQQGDYARGLPAYESRWHIARARKRDVPLKRWDGSQLGGRSIYIHDEQGFGDILQFARFLPLLKDRFGAGKVVFECQPELMRLMALAPGIDAVIPRERVIPQCDVYCALLSLPGLMGITLDNLPNTVPYLNAPAMAPDTASALPQDQRLKVGMVWAGQLIPRDRSCPLDKILPLLGDPLLAPVSLQFGERAADLVTLGADALITDMAPYLRDFAETAAVLRELDLLITIDTSVAHLAGALGIKTFLLLRYTSDWRWFDRITHSPWYPTLTVFRQQRDCRWDTPLAELAREVQAFVAQEASTL